MEGIYIRAKFGCATFNIHQQLYLDIKTYDLNYNAWKQRYELSLMRILV